jgi:hypothetical protein
MKIALNLLNINMNNYPYTFGHKPIASDFALFGQLTQLAASAWTIVVSAHPVAPS